MVDGRKEGGRRNGGRWPSGYSLLIFDRFITLRRACIYWYQVGVDKCRRDTTTKNNNNNNNENTNNNNCGSVQGRARVSSCGWPGWSFTN